MPELPPNYAQAVTILLEFYKENTTHGRHLETQRQLVSGLVLAIAAAAIGALAALRFQDRACLLLGAVLLGDGFLGTAFSIVQYGKYAQTRERFRALRDQLDLLCPTAGLSSTMKKAKSATKTWGHVGKFPLHWLWIFLNAGVLGLGIFLIVHRGRF
jgi:hypothetical protein